MDEHDGVHSPEQREKARQQEWRRNYLVPIYVMWTSDVPQLETQAALQGVIDAVHASGQERQILNFGSRQFSSGVNYFSPDWYIQEASRRQPLRRNAGYGPQVDASEVIRLFREEPWQENPHWEVFIVNQDLNTKGVTGEYINFIFGETDVIFPASVQSVTRLMAEVKNQDTRRAMIRRLLRHEVGHMLGLPARSQKVENKLGLHCTNVCTMKQGMSIREWRDNTIEEGKIGIHFCTDCLNDLAIIRPRFKPLPTTHH